MATLTENEAHYDVEAFLNSKFSDEEERATLAQLCPNDRLQKRVLDGMKRVCESLKIKNAGGEESDMLKDNRLYRLYRGNFLI